MFTEVTLKVFSDCCICFAFLGACPSLLPYSYPLALAALICGLSAGLASYFSDKGENFFSRLCTPLPLVSLLLAEGGREMFILIPVILYAAAVILRGTLQLDYYSFRRYFIRSLVLLIVMWIGVNLCNFIEDPKGIKEMLIQPGNILRYGIVHFICGITLQRQLRIGSQKHARDSRSQLLATLGGTSAVIFGFVAAEPLLRESAVKLARLLFTVLIAPIAAVIEFFIHLFLQVVEEVQNSELYQEALQHAEEINPAGPNTYQEMYQELIKDAPESGTPIFALLFTIIGMLTAVVLMFMVFSKMRKTGDILGTERLADTPRRERTRFNLSPRARIRQSYRDFLKQEKRRGTKIRKDCTTEEILRRLSSGANQTAAGELRELYIRARYDETREVSRAQAEAARTALRRIHEK